jgi:hypothetical protein
MADKSFDKILKSIPLETRIEVVIEGHFIVKHKGSFLIPASEKGEEYEAIMKANGKAYEEAKPIIDMVKQVIQEWREDGCPPPRDKTEEE